MIIILLAVLLFGPARAAVTAVDLGAPKPSEPYWFKVYSTAPYKEFWTGELTVKNLEKDLPKAVAAIEKGGGKLTQPLANFVSSTTDKSQQMTFTLSLKNAKSLLKPLRKLGALADPAVRPTGAPIPMDEIGAKIDVLLKEKTEHAAELAAVPAAAAAEEEILEHLLMVEEVARRTDTEVSFNLLVKQKQ